MSRIPGGPWDALGGARAHFGDSSTSLMERRLPLTLLWLLRPIAVTSCVQQGGLGCGPCHSAHGHVGLGKTLPAARVSWDALPDVAGDVRDLSHTGKPL